MSESRSVVSDSDPMGYTVHGILKVRILEWVAIPFSIGSSNPRIEPRSRIAGRFLMSEPPGKPLGGGREGQKKVMAIIKDGLWCSSEGSLPGRTSRLSAEYSLIAVVRNE